MNGLRVLHQVTDLELASQIIDDSPAKIIEYQDDTFWVDVDQPWDVNIALQLSGATGNFMVVDAEGGRVAGPYNARDKAIRAKDSAKVVMVADIDLEDEESAGLDFIEQIADSESAAFTEGGESS